MKETALNFGPSGRLVGILTRPDAGEPDSGDHPAVVFLNAGILHRIGPNRIHVRLARALASQGICSLRLDFPGVGDSGTLGTTLSLIEEAQESVTQAIGYLADRGLAHRFIVFGLCSGADAAFRMACTDPRVVGLVLVDPTYLFPTRRTWRLRLVRAALRPGPWIRLLSGRYGVLRRLRSRIGGRSEDGPGDLVSNPGSQGDGSSGPGAGRATAGYGGVSTRLTTKAREVASEALAGLVDRNVRICHIITGDQRELYNYRTQLLDAFPELELERVTQLELFETARHTFPLEADRVELEDTVTEWVAKESFSEAPNSSSPMPPRWISPREPSR